MSEDTARSLGALVRMDAAYGRAARRLAELDHQQSGLRRAMGDLDNARERLASPKSLRPQSSEALGQTDLDKVERIESQIAELKRLLREAERASNGNAIGRSRSAEKGARSAPNPRPRCARCTALQNRR